MPMIDIPAHVQHESHVQNHIPVVGGTNWDLSRSAVATPITLLPPPEPPAPAGYQPEHKMPAEPATLTVHYARGSAVLSKQALAELKTLPPKSTVVVAGHSDQDESRPATLAQRRADTVAAALRKQGHNVTERRAFADAIPVTLDRESAVLNRRVDVFKK